MTLTIGEHVPDLGAFSTTALPDFSGHWTVMYFYPLGNNPHCVMESRRFQALVPEFTALGVQLVGVSVDTEEEQRMFRALCNVSFPLISDVRKEISAAFGMLQTVEHEGKTYTVARRETLLIDPHGRVAHHWTPVDPNTHAQEVLDDFRSRFAATGCEDRGQEVPGEAGV